MIASMGRTFQSDNGDDMTGVTIDDGPVPTTERRHPASADLDSLDSTEILELLNREDAGVSGAVAAVIPDLARLVDRASLTLDAGGRVHYFGAGTSGRLAVLDAAELIPTFNLEPSMVTAHIAGGARAVVTPVEGSEDSTTEGADAAADVAAGDIAIGVAASGTTPYVLGALHEARLRGAFTALITSNPAVRADVDLLLAADTGPEVLTGSTRLKAGTAAKLMLNGFSTALMIRQGRAWSNLMVSLVATNQKLRHRSVRILGAASGLPLDEAAGRLDAAGGELKTALVSELARVDLDRARAALARHRGSVRDALVGLAS